MQGRCAAPHVFLRVRTDWREERPAVDTRNGVHLFLNAAVCHRGLPTVQCHRHCGGGVAMLGGVVHRGRCWGPGFIRGPGRHVSEPPCWSRARWLGPIGIASLGFKLMLSLKWPFRGFLPRPLPRGLSFTSVLGPQPFRRATPAPQRSERWWETQPHLPAGPFVLTFGFLCLPLFLVLYVCR